MLITKLQEDLTASLKAKDQEKLSTLRFLMSDLKNAQIDKGSDLSDEEIIKIIKKSVKKLNDAAEMFEEGGRSEMADENKAQIAVLKEYLPTELSDSELEKAIQDLISENQELFDKNPKAIIGITMKKLSSQADPKRIMAQLNKAGA